MAPRRPLGISLLAGLFFAKAAALAIAAAAAVSRTGLGSGASAYIAGAAPITRLAGAGHTLALSPFAVAIYAAFGIGLWFLRPRAWAYLVIFYGVAVGLIALALLLAVLSRGKISLLPRSAAFGIGVLIEVVVLAYLLTPDVKRAFEENA